MGVGLFVATATFLGFKTYRQNHDGALYLKEAKKRLELNQPNLAIQYLNRYLSLSGDDIEALDLKAKVLADSARNAEEALDAMPIHNQVLGRDPDNPKRQETRRRLVELNLKVGGRERAAEGLARELIQRGANDARAHCLLAMALEAGAGDSDKTALQNAAAEFEAALKIEPDDVGVAERLAILERDKLNNPAKAVQVLDDLVKASAKTPAKKGTAHLARARYFASAGNLDKASAEVDLALAADPNNLEVRLTAADAANQRGDTATARKHLAAIPESARSELRIKLLAGMIELNERRPDAAIESWRSGLVQTGGSNTDLTWRLAQVLLEMGRTQEAEPLIAQYRRLAGGEEPDFFYRYLSAYSLLKRDRASEAIKEIEEIRYKVPKTLEARLYHLLGQAYERVNDTAKALGAYRQATKSSPHWSTPWVAVANIQGSEHLEEARRTLEQGQVLSPGDPGLAINLALLYLRQQLLLPRERRTWGDVEKSLAAARKVAPSSAELALVEADYFLAAEKPEDALKTLRAATKQNDRSAPLWMAQANLLARLGRTTEAMDTVNRGIAVAPEAGLFVIRSSILMTLGHLKQARNELIDSLSKVSPEQQYQIWKALGEFYLNQSDMAAAHHAFEEWARLQPGSADPRVALLNMALKSGDEAAIRTEVDAMKTIGGPETPYWRVAKAEALLRDRAGEPPDPAQQMAEFEEASRLIRELQTNQPHAPSGYLLEGRLLEKKGETDAAVAAYKKALTKRGGNIALSPLITLLVREGRDADLAKIRRESPGATAEFERLASVQALKAGDKARAEQLASLVVQGDPKGLDVRVWQAQVLDKLGKPKDAEATLQRLIEQNPDSPTALLQLLMLQASQKEAKAGAATIELIRKRVKSNRPELLLAQCYRVLGDIAKAETAFNAALAKWPDDLAVRTAAISFYEQTGRQGDTEASLRHVLKIDPALSWASRSLALSLANHVGDRAAWDEAIALIGPTAKPDDTPDDRMTRARILANGPDLKSRQEAIVILEELASEMPNAAPVQEQLARLLSGSGQLDKARAHAERAAGEGAAPDAILLYAGILLASKSYDEADRQFDRLTQVDPNNLAVAELRSRGLAARGRQKEAADVLEKAFSAQPNNADTVALGEKVGGLLLRLNQPEAAERVARRLSTLSPKGMAIYATVLGGRGKTNEAAALLEKAAAAGAYADAGSAALALTYAPKADPRWLGTADRYLTQALKLQPNSLKALHDQARVRYLQNRFQDQIVLYQAMLKRNPSDLLFLNEMAWTLSENLNKPQEGLDRANEVVKHIGRQANLLDTRGVILTRLGKYDEAIQDLEAAVGAMPTGPFYYHLARAYLKKGSSEDFKKARAHAKEAGLRPDQLQTSERADWQEIMER